MFCDRVVIATTNIFSFFLFSTMIYRHKFPKIFRRCKKFSFSLTKNRLKAKTKKNICTGYSCVVEKSRLLNCPPARKHRVFVRWAVRKTRVFCTADRNNNYMMTYCTDYYCYCCTDIIEKQFLFIFIIIAACYRSVMNNDGRIFFIL